MSWSVTALDSDVLSPKPQTISLYHQLLTIKVILELIEELSKKSQNLSKNLSKELNSMDYFFCRLSQPAFYDRCHVVLQKAVGEINTEGLIHILWNGNREL
jgi:hypothetical protein